MKITGMVADDAKAPLGGYAIVAYHGDVDLPEEAILRRGRTGPDGRYALSIDLSAYPRGANIRVAVLGKSGTQLWSSTIHYNTKSDLTLDAEIPAGALDTTAYRRLADRVESRVRLAELSRLNPTQRAYLANGVGVADADLAALVSATEMHDAIPAVTSETFYGLLKGGLPASVDLLLLLDESHWRDALARAMNDNLVKRLSPRTVGRVVAVLNARRVSVMSPAGDEAAALAALATPSDAKRKRIASVAARHHGLNEAFWKALPRAAGVTAKDVARLKDAADVSNVLGQDPELLEEVAGHLRQSGEALTPSALATIDGSTWQTLLKNAARKRRAVTPGRPVAGKGRPSSSQTAHTIAARVAWLLPTRALAAEINSAPAVGYFGEHKKGLSDFFSRNKAFDIRADQAEFFRPVGPSSRTGTDGDPVRERVKTLARLYRALPEAHATATPDAAGGSVGVLQRLSALADSKHQYRSSFDISRRPRAAFAAEIARTERDVAYWESVHDQATAMSDITHFMAVSMLQRERMSTHVTKSLFPPENAADSEQPGVADLRTLFGSLDRCECEQCTSVTSPASYLADTLNFLQTDVAASGQQSPYDVLVARRPDLPHILLNCDNTNVELPYIDVVNELLEDEVLRQNDVSPIWAPYRNVTLQFSPKYLDLAALRDPPLATEAKRAIAIVLNAALPGYDFDSDLQVSVRRWREDGAGDRWFVFNKGWLLELAYDGSTVSDGSDNTRSARTNLKNFIQNRTGVPSSVDSDPVSVEHISRQTYGTSDELDANPLFRNARVAKILEGKDFPASLPPGLPLLEARLFLEHLKLPREQLIRELTPAKVDIWAVEYLGLSAADVVQLGVAGGAARWGFAAPIVTVDDVVVDPANSTKLLTGVWVDILRRVDVLIARARISYIDLLDMLGCESVNPTLRNGNRATIVSTDGSDPATCDLSKLEIQLDSDDFQDVLERMRRFLRLQRRMGWKTWELDLALRQFAPALVDPRAPSTPSVATKLIPLAVLKRVRATLLLSHADACALLGEIDRVRRFDYRVEGQPAVPSQYEALLLNRAMTNPVDARFQLDDHRSALRSPPPAGDGIATLAAAFQVDASDIALILERVNVALTDTLTLNLISAIYRRVLFARGLGISVQELTWIEQVNGGLPTVDECLEFIDRVAVVRRSSLSVTEAWYLLADGHASTAYLVPDDDEIGQQLDQIRRQLAKIEADHVVPGPPDIDGAQLRRILGELDFGAPLIDDLLGVVTDTKLFSVDATLPAAAVNALDLTAGVAFTPPTHASFLRKPDVAPLVRYRSDDGVLLAMHPLTRSDRATLLRATSNGAFRRAVETLYALGRLSYQDGRLSCRGLLPSLSVQAAKQRVNRTVFTNALDAIVEQQTQLLARKLLCRGLAQYEFPLQSATPLSIPSELQPYVYLDQVRNVLVVRGQPTDLELAALAAALPAGILAVLRNGPLPARANDVPLFLSAAEIQSIFDPDIAPDMPVTIADISRELLETRGLMAYAGDLLKRKAIVTTLGGALGLTDGVTQYLLRKVPSATQGASIAGAFAALSNAAATSPLAPYQSDYRRLSKMALLLQRLKIQEVHLPWLFDYPTADWLSVLSLQVGKATAGTDLAKLAALIRLIAIASRSPYSPQLVDRVLELAVRPGATVVPILKVLVGHSGWTKTDVPTICLSLAISSPQEFLKALTFERLRVAMDDVARLGATAEQAVQLTTREIDDAAAVVAKSLAKSKHAATDWLKVAEPINDILREARRSALVDFLVTHPRRIHQTRNQKTGPPLWHDVDTLYEYLLVDVQMGACMKTTRIRLALNSVQLFVQRCLMNLEADVAIGDEPQIRGRWDEWESWRKLYRVWEANRKVFLYPEDWMDPALRDDKTPFFQELEDELLQADVTNDTAEAAILNYLHKLDEVSKLEVMGIFIEEGEPSEDPETQRLLQQRVLHVVARTYGEPHEWFYRTLTSSRPQPWHKGVWSAWERIGTDVEGDHVMPVVWNSHVYLFWALFDQKADRPTSKELNDKDTVHDSKNRWYIRIAWSERRNGKWTSKRLSKESLSTPCLESGDRTVFPRREGADTVAPSTAEDFSFNTYVTNDRIQIKCYGPVVAAQPPTGGTSGAAVPAKDPPLWTGSSQVSIDFVDPTTGHWRTDIDITVYEGESEIVSLRAKDNNGRFDLWSYFGWNPIPTWWKNAAITVRTTPKVAVLNTLQTVRQNGTELTFTAQIVTSAPNEITTIGGPGAVVISPPLTMSRIGRFDYDTCRGDLTPVAEAVTGTLPLLGTTTTRRGMMYVEIEDPVTGTPPSQPFLTALTKTPRGRYRVLLPHQYSAIVTNDAFFFQTDRDVFLVTPNPPGYRFNVFYHPFTCDFVATTTRDGVDKLLTLKSQLNDDRGQHFKDDYGPDVTQVDLTELDDDNQSVAVTREDVDFSGSGAFGVYNWELFFHIPWLIATRLQANQRFEEARRWYHYLFDPTSRPGADAPATELKPTQRFWNVLPFWRAEGKEIRSIDDLLRGAADLSEAFRQWRQDPFKPFVVGRARQSAFMLSVVMAYLDNLIEWGDQQFEQFTAESTNEATLLYVLASQILGRAPEQIPTRVRSSLQTYQSLQEHAAGGVSPMPSWQSFSDVMVEIETFVPPSAAVVQFDTSSPLGRMWAFCVPPNDKLLQAWPRVAQRLFSLRHCRDLEGVQRSFPIWDPPLDPGLLVRAAAAGVDLASVLGDINAATPHYRFSVILERAMELCNELKGFGAALLSALDNNDAEGLSLLRAKQEVALSEKVKEVRQRQRDQSTAQREAAERSKVAVEARRDHYQGLQFRNAGESAAQALSGAAIVEETVAGISEGLGAVAALLPQFGYGTSGVYSSPVVLQTYGGEQLSRAASATAAAARASGSVLSMTAAGALTQAGYDRRSEEWDLQITLAQRELDQIERQIVAAQIQEDIAQKELDNQQLQIEDAKAVADYLTGKYTNQQLFGWMQGQLSSLYFQAYKLTFEMAKKAERAFGHELGVFNARYVEFGYWDSLKKGLLAGERLQSDLRRMQAAYLDRNAREYEITKHVSMTALDPAALVLLKATGRCEVELPEWLFDMDHAGHCMRRIKSMALSIPCVTGPYTSVNSALTQLSSKVRLPDSDANDYGNATNFHEYFGSAQTIVTSSGREDTGLFEADVRDERYLPFEGTGAISRWRIELPIESNQFDLWTISDLVLHLRYTARPGGDDLQQAAKSQIPFKGARLLSLRHEFPSEWAQMTTVLGAATSATSDVSLSKDRFPYFFTSKDKTLSITSVRIYALPSDDASNLTFPESLKVYLAPRPAGDLGNRSSALDAASDVSIGRLSGKAFKASVELRSARDVATWTFEVTSPASFKRSVDDLLIVCEYELPTNGN